MAFPANHTNAKIEPGFPPAGEAKRPSGLSNFAAMSILPKTNVVRITGNETPAKVNGNRAAPTNKRVMVCSLFWLRSTCLTGNLERSNLIRLVRQADPPPQDVRSCRPQSFGVRMSRSFRFRHRPAGKRPPCARPEGEGEPPTRTGSSNPTCRNGGEANRRDPAL